MDNNNQNPNQTPNPNGYTNFNNYQPQTPPQGTAPVPPQGVPPVPPQRQYAPQYGYQPVPQENKNKSLVLGIISIVLSAIGCCGCAFFSTIPSAILGLIGVIRNKKSVVSWIGLVLGVLFSIVWIAYFVYAFSNPEVLREILSNAYDEDTVQMLMDSIYGFIMSRIG